jgi:hypothetical protein
MALIDSLNAKREEANRIVGDILKQSKVIEENVQKSKELVKDITITTDDSKMLNSTLNRIISSTNEAVVKFKEQHALVSKLLIQVNNFL